MDSLSNPPPLLLTIRYDTIHLPEQDEHDVECAVCKSPERPASMILCDGAGDAAAAAPAAATVAPAAARAAAALLVLTSPLSTPGCDEGFHMHCLSPPLATLPEGQWHCASCSDSGSSPKVSAQAAASSPVPAATLPRPYCDRSFGNGGALGTHAAACLKQQQQQVLLSVRFPPQFWSVFS